MNTLFSCLCTLTPEFNFVPEWRPPFISSLASEDRCHLNGLAVNSTGPQYVTCMSQTDTRQGWRPTKASSGVLLNVPQGEVLAGGFAMPHSPRIVGEHVVVLDSGNGSVEGVSQKTGARNLIAKLPGFTRGLDISGKLAFIGLSRIRETSTFGGIPIAEKRESLKCGVAIVNLETGELAGTFEFRNGVEEIFDVRVLPGITNPTMRGPVNRDEDRADVWLVPTPAR